GRASTSRCSAGRPARWRWSRCSAAATCSTCATPPAAAPPSAPRPATCARRGAAVVIEFALLLLVAAVAAAYVAFPRAEPEPAEPDVEELRAQREELLRELRDLDEDAAAGRISPENRAAGRRALAPRLRAVTEALRERGEDLEAPAAAPPS